MAQDDDGPVVVVGGSVLESMHHTVERRMEWGSGSQREVESDMDRTRLGSRRLVRPGIDQPGLVVSPGTDRRAALGEPALYAEIEFGWSVLGRFAGNQRAAGAEIDRCHRSRAQIAADQGREPCRLLRQPGHDPRGMRHGRQATGIAKGVVRESWMDRREDRQRPGQGYLADPKVVVPGAFRG